MQGRDSEKNLVSVDGLYGVKFVNLLSSTSYESVGDFSTQTFTCMKSVLVYL